MLIVTIRVKQRGEVTFLGQSIFPAALLKNYEWTCDEILCRAWALLKNTVPPGPCKSLKVLKFHTFKYKAPKSP